MSNTMEDPVQQGSLHSGGFELRYRVEGQGPPVMVIGSAVYYPRTFSRRLRASLQLIFVDHRGFARGPDALAQADMELDVILDDIDRLRRHLGLTRMAVLGHSGHGYMALEYAKRHGQHVSHVMMVATGPSLGEAHAEMAAQYWEETASAERKARLEQDLRLLPAEIAARPEARFIAFLLRMGAKSWFDHEFDATPLWAGVEIKMPVFDHLWGQVFRDIDITQGLDELQVPVWLGLGRHDYLVAPWYSWEPYRGRFRDLTVELFERSGHTPQLEEPEAFDRALLGWLAAAT